MKKYLLLYCCFFCLSAFGQVSVVKRMEWVFPPQKLTPLGNALYFIAADQEDHLQLWKSDGSAAGTLMVKNFSTTEVFGIEEMVAVNGRLFFVASTPEQGTELWTSDGTATGTRLLKDIYPGNLGSNPTQLTRVGASLFFTADYENTGRELWRSDGTSAGTVLVKDFNPGASSSMPSNLIEVNGALYCSAMQNSRHHLLKSDGNNQGTLSLKVFDLSPETFAKVGSTLYFTARGGIDYNQLWKSNGEANNTIQVKQLCSELTELKGVGTQLYLYGEDCSAPQAGLELLISNGTAAGTKLLKDIHPDYTSYLNNIIGLGDLALFVADDGKNGFELWRSDGTSAGTQLLKDINEGSSGSKPAGFCTWGNLLYFAAERYGLNASGRELWRSDGTANGTYLVKDILPGEQGSDPEALTLVNDQLFFVAYDSLGVGRQLWKMQAFVVPTCSLPSSYTLSASKLTTQSATLNSGMSAYSTYHFAYRKLGASDWSENIASSNSWDIQGLTPATDYEFRVKVKCDNQLWSDWSQLAQFRTLTPVPVDTFLTFYLDKSTVKPGDTAYLAIRVNKFEKIGGFQFTVASSSTQTRILGIEASPGFSTLQSRQHNPQRWSIAWYDPGLVPQTLEDASAIATLKIVLASNTPPNECIQIQFEKQPTDIIASQLINDEIIELKPQTRNGSLCASGVGAFADSSPDFAARSTPQQFTSPSSQHQVIPNPSYVDPFFQFEAQHPGEFKLEVLDLAGRTICQYTFYAHAGRNKVLLNGLSGNLASGLLHYRAFFPSGTLSGKFLLLK